MTDLENHKIVPENEWIHSRNELLKKEKSSQSCTTNLASKEEICLGWALIEYFFDGPNGKQALSELFDGRSQLIVYHFMFDPDWEAACLHCSF